MCSGQRRKQLSRLARGSPTLNWLDLPDTVDFYSFQLRLICQILLLLFFSTSTARYFLLTTLFSFYSARYCRFLLFSTSTLPECQILLLLLFPASTLPDTFTSTLFNFYSRLHCFFSYWYSPLFWILSTPLNTFYSFLANVYSGELNWVDRLDKQFLLWTNYFYFSQFCSSCTLSRFIQNFVRNLN